MKQTQRTQIPIDKEQQTKLYIGLETEGDWGRGGEGSARYFQYRMTKKDSGGGTQRQT